MKQIRENSFREIPLQTTNAQLSKLLRKKGQSRSSSSDVPQLGAQKKQSIEPLVVRQTTQQQDFVIFLKESNLTVAQIAGGEDIPKADVVVKWTYELGKSLVPPK